MTVEDISAVLRYLIAFCAAPALIINLTQFGVNALICAVTGKGLKLNGK